MPGGLTSFYQFRHKLWQRRLRAEPGLQYRTFRSTTAAASTEDLTDLGVLKQLHHASSVGESAVRLHLTRSQRLFNWSI
jgi:hypothetical protein